MAHIGVLAQNADQIYRYMNFDQISEFRDVADSVAV
jgi:aconitate hydratase 2/2-methylisocitrate dehydratase